MLKLIFFCILFVAVIAQGPQDLPKMPMPMPPMPMPNPSIRASRVVRQAPDFNPMPPFGQGPGQDGGMGNFPGVQAMEKMAKKAEDIFSQAADKFPTGGRR